MDIIENDIQGVIAGKTIYSMILFLSNNQSYGCIHMHSKDGKGAQGGCIRHALPSSEFNSSHPTRRGRDCNGADLTRCCLSLPVPICLLEREHPPMLSVTLMFQNVCLSCHLSPTCEPTPLPGAQPTKRRPGPSQWGRGMWTTDRDDPPWCVCSPWDTFLRSCPW